jgi:hypothetical protein
VHRTQAPNCFTSKPLPHAAATTSTSSTTTPCLTREAEEPITPCYHRRILDEIPDTTPPSSHFLFPHTIQKTFQERNSIMLLFVSKVSMHNTTTLG